MVYMSTIHRATQGFPAKKHETDVDFTSGITEPKTEIQFCYSHLGCDQCIEDTVDYLGTEVCTELAA